jgi:acyl carrier protein
MTVASLQNNRQNLRAFLAEQLPRWSDEATDTESLEPYGLDSTGIAVLVMYLEETFNLQILDEELTEKNLGTIESVLGFLERKTAAGT